MTYDYVIVGAGTAAIPRDLQRVELLALPADPDAEVDPPARQPVEVGDLLGRVQRVALRHQADAGAEADRGRQRGQHAERGERVEQTGVAADREAPARVVRVGRLVLVEQHHVLAHPQRIESGLLDPAGDVGDDVGPVVNGYNSGPTGPLINLLPSLPLPVEHEAASDPQVSSRSKQNKQLQQTTPCLPLCVTTTVVDQQRVTVVV